MVGRGWLAGFVGIEGEANRVAFEPDILINTPDGRVMVVGAKVAILDFPRTQLALKQYMAAMQYPFGLLVTLEKVRVYRDFYSAGLRA